MKSIRMMRSIRILALFILLLFLLSPVLITSAEIEVTKSTNIDVPTNGEILASAYTWVNGTTDADMANVTVYVNGLITNYSVAVSGTTFNISNVMLGVDGDYKVNVSAMDAAGNANLTNATVTVTVDTTPPTAPTNLIHTDDAPSDYDNDNNTDISWFAATDIYLTVIYRVYRDGVLNGSTTSLEYTFTNETEGSHTYNVSANDSVGNINTTNESVTITVDYTNPVIHNVSLNDTSPSYGQQISVIVNVTDTNIASVTAGSTSLTHQSGALWNGTITAGYGANTVTVTAYDNASNSDTNSSRTYTGPAAPKNNRGGGSNELPANIDKNQVEYLPEIVKDSTSDTSGFSSSSISAVQPPVQAHASSPTSITSIQQLDVGVPEVEEENPTTPILAWVGLLILLTMLVSIEYVLWTKQ